MYPSCELKFENTAKVGSVIKAFDFEPSELLPDSFILGVVKSKGWVADLEYKAYVVECIYDSTDHEKYAHLERSRKGRTVYVPFETSMDYDNRITKV